MNALPPHPFTYPQHAEAAEHAPEHHAWPDAARTLRLVQRLAAFYLAAAGAALFLLARPRGAVGGCGAAGGGGGGGRGGGGAPRAGRGRPPPPALLLPLAGLLATGPLAAARLRLGQPAPPHARTHARPPARWTRLARRIVAPDPARHLARLARRPQGIIVPTICLAAAVTAYAFRPAAFDPSPGALLTGAAAIIAAFPLLVAERIVAGTARLTLPEAPALQALLFVPVIAIPLAGLAEIGASLGLPWTPVALALIAAYVGLVAAELAARALANWFLPPPPPADARAAVASLAALLLQPGRLAPDGAASPIRQHLGIDFSRSYALRYIRAATIPVTAVLALFAWGLTGVSLIPLNQRGIYERLGEPVAVWAPGAHLGLPWPLGRVRPVDLGTIHTVLLGTESAPVAPSAAEAPAPASADRLWDGVHPAEVSYLIASRETDGRQAFQSVDVDLRILYRIGLDDRSARQAAYNVATPDALVRAEAGRLLARTFASQQIADVLGDGRERLGETLRTQMQAELARANTGIDLVGMVIEAIHPPAGAADAYHNVQAAEIIANTAISTERGRAQATASRARQTSTELVDAAQGQAADTTGQARTAARTFTADQDGATAGGASFLLERYLANITAALAKSPLVIVDHRLNGPEAPVIDLRPFGAPPTRQADDD